MGLDDIGIIFLMMIHECNEIYTKIIELSLK